MLNITKRKYAPLCNHHRTCRQRMDKQCILSCLWGYVVSCISTSNVSIFEELRAKILHNKRWHPSSVLSYFLAVTIRYRHCWIFSCLRHALSWAWLVASTWEDFSADDKDGDRILIWGFQRWQRLHFPFRKILDIRVRWGLADGIFHLPTLNS